MRRQNKVINGNKARIWGQIFCFADDYAAGKHRLHKLRVESHGNLK
ncbi:hypothetical protein KAX97_10935 [candidate division WOR-3 bacterium]|nr:hypothetical protein [candidate division WOR-3 bacterium]